MTSEGWTRVFQVPLFYFQINRAISVAEATSDMRGKANPDESQIYVGFNDRSDNDFTLVKKYLGKRRKKYLVDLRDS